LLNVYSNKYQIRETLESFAKRIGMNEYVIIRLIHETMLNAV